MGEMYVTLLLETDETPETVHLAVQAAIPERYKIRHAGVHTPADIEGAEVVFVVCPLRGLLRVFVDDSDTATEFAQREGAVTVEWTADADYRGEVTA